MNRLLTLASGGLFTAGLAILPISAFAQQNGPDSKADAKIVAPMMQTSTDAKAPTPGLKTEAAKDTKMHHVKRVVTPVSTPKATAPASHAATGSKPSSTTKAVQPKAVDQSKS
jgi:hypothetical protein